MPSPRVLERHAHERSFWIIQLMVGATTVVHLLADRTWESRPDSALLASTHQIPVVLYAIPVVYAGLSYGLEGGVFTGAWAAVLASVNIVVWHRESFAWAGEVTFMMIVVGMGIVMALPVERERNERERAEAAAARLDLLNRIAAALASKSDLATMLEPVPRLLVDFMGVRGACIGLWEPDRDEPLVLIARASGSDASRIEDVLRRHARGAPTAADGGNIVTGCIAARNVSGGIAILPEAANLAAVDRELLHAVASELGVAVENAMMHRQESERLHSYVRLVTRTQEEERKRMASDLHDDVAQPLALMCRWLDDVAGRGCATDPDEENRLGELRDLAHVILQTVRRCSRDLRPAVLDDLGLVAALDWLASDLAARTGVDSRFAVSGSPRRLAPETEVALFRIAQEALRNVERHGRATTVAVTALFGGDAVELAVSDDGPGFEWPAPPSELVRRGQLGIVGMHERAELVGAELTIRSTPGGGTTVRVRV